MAYYHSNIPLVLLQWHLVASYTPGQWGFKPLPIRTILKKSCLSSVQANNGLESHKSGINGTFNCCRFEIIGGYYAPLPLLMFRSVTVTEQFTDVLPKVHK